MKIHEWDASILDIVALGEVFGEESGLNPEQRKHQKKVIDDLWLAFNDPQIGLFISYKDKTPAGFGIVMIDSLFMHEPTAVINKFYIHPDFRGTGVSRELLKEMCDWVDFMCVKHMYVTSTGHIGQNKAFENLVKKFDFNIEGNIYKRTT